MAIYRGSGGAGDATNDITINRVAELASEAEVSATSASSSATAASTSAGAASTSATNAANSATAASTSETNAASSTTSAASSATNAASSETNAAASETAAAASETAAGLSETAAAASETNAATSATNAATSATNASTSATSASSSASSASTSATNASTSETNAASSASAAATSATNAASSATSASNDAATATTKASEASTSASNAATSETNAAASESAAATSATNASTPETNAAASETAAASSASAASTSATNAATSASSASTSASNASTSETNAATSETNAATSETNAAASATAAAASAASAASSDYATSSWYTTTNNSSNWDTAYGWGNHASAGYLVNSNNLSDLNSASTALTNLGISNHDDITVDGSGNVGIGTTSTTQKLQLRGTSSDTIDETKGTMKVEASGGNGMLLGTLASSPYTSYIQSAFVSDTSLAQYNLALNPIGGNVGIGNTSPSTKLDVTGDVTVTGTLNVRTAIDLADNDILRFGTGDDCELFCNGSHMYMDLNAGIGNFYIRDGTTTRYTFDDNGSFTATGDVTAYSDERLKENWKDLPEGFVANLAGVKSGTYNRIDLDGKQQVGVSAQSLQTVLPDAVTESNDTLAVNYGNAALASAIELAKKVVELEARIKELESK